MTFIDVVKDVKKLVGLDLQSIRPGAAIKILEVDEEKSCIILRTQQGQIRSRPLSELQIIWDELNRIPAVHVEGVLHGSGTSRNQPETILANLPYIEWLKINNKKHIALVEKNSHAYGTLRQMNSIDAASLINSFQIQEKDEKPRVVIVTNDIAGTLNELSTIIQGSLITLGSGIYKYIGVSFEMLIILASHCNLAVGSYLVIPQSHTTSSKVIDICGSQYYVISESSSAKILMKKD